MRQERLFTLAPEIVLTSASYEPAAGWSLRVVMRRQDQSWDEAYEAQYSGLSTPELADVLFCEISTLLALT